MIKIKVYKNAFVIEGHALFAEHGTDIVCAGVSAIAMGALNWFDQQTTSITVNDGFIKVIAKQSDIKAIEYIDLIAVQLQAIALSYSKNVQLKRINNFYERD